MATCFFMTLYCTLNKYAIKLHVRLQMLFKNMHAIEASFMCIPDTCANVNELLYDLQ